MSQHYLSTKRSNGEPVEVLMGWDRPLARYFCVIETTAQASGTDDVYLYDNVSDRKANSKDLGYYKAKLAELGVPVPESMFAEVQRDGDVNAGNRCVRHQMDGTFTEISPG